MGRQSASSSPHRAASGEVDVLSPSLLHALLETMYPPAQSSVRSDWKLRYSDYQTGGTWTSARPISDSHAVTASSLNEVARWYQERDCIPRVQVLEPSVHDAVLAQAGWRIQYSAVVLTASLKIPAALSSTSTVTIRSITALDQPYAPDGTVVGECREDGIVLGAGRAQLIELPAISDSPIWLGFTSFLTNPESRRKGVATSLLATLARYGLEHSARNGVLQLIVGNRAAFQVYQRAGFESALRYCYWVPSVG